MANEISFKEKVEQAKTDPAWQKVEEFVENVPQVKMFPFWGRLTDIIVFTQDMLRLSSMGKEHLVRRSMTGVPELVGKYLKADSGEQRAQMILYVTAEMEKAFREKVKQYDLWILNQGLVMFCTVMDIFLETVLESILRSNVQILYGVAGAKNIDLKHAVGLGSLDAVIDEIRKKEIRKFCFEEIEERFEYMESKLGIRTTDVFDWRNQTDEAKERLAGWNLGALKEIYGKRHAIVHRDALPIKTIDELSTIQSFFVQIVANLGLLVSKKHNLPLDAHLFMNKLDLYEQFKSSESKEPGG